MERWKWVVGYEGFYQVSDLGRVRSVDRVVKHWRGGPTKLAGRIRRLSPCNRFGHLTVSLSKEGIKKSIHVHRLVAEAWIGPCPEGQEVRHGPDGASNNSLSNLRYGTRSENNLDKRRDGTNGGRRVVRSDGIEFASMCEAAEDSNCCVSHICDVCKGRYKHKTAGGYGWKYADEGPG